ncbi:MAG TPA: hypothetical protein VHE78_15360 [Gemmatimonadaceae bacterium]|nr:hypothetical protein [Gemmatimonadaceae bacterium]
MRRFSSALRAIVACIPALLLGDCDRSKPQLPPAETITPEGAPPLDITAKPQLLFQVFGNRADLRVVPLAAVVKGVVKPIGLTERGWRLLDSLYFAPGARYPVYHEDGDVGEVVIRRGMWSGGAAPLYPLAGCSALKPLAAATITFKQPTPDPYVELIGSSASLAPRVPYKGTLLTEAEIAKLGRAFGHEVGKQGGIQPSELDSLDFHARLLVTGATSEPTLLVSFIDPNAGDLGPGAGHATHLFALGEKSGSAYAPAYRHAVSGNAREVEFQRLVDHLDVSGSGVAELILEAWRYGAENETVVLSFRGDAWRETMRSKQSWCLDPPLTKK